MNIGIIEDDLLQRTALRNWLEEAGHQCHCFDSASEFVQRAKHDDYKLLLLDWEMPGVSGIELLGWLRKQQQDDTPVIFITSHDTETDIVTALRRGADDYLVKPARRQELLARIDALTRRMNSTDSSSHHFGNIHLDAQQQSIYLDGERVELTQKEYSLARFLLKNCGQLITRDELMEKVWRQTGELNTRTVDTHISRLRKKLRLNREHGWHLGAVYQSGYRLDRLTR